MAETYVSLCVNIWKNENTCHIHIAPNDEGFIQLSTTFRALHAITPTSIRSFVPC